MRAVQVYEGDGRQDLTHKTSANIRDCMLCAGQGGTISVADGNYVQCPTCRGTGKVAKDSDPANSCGKCSGTGLWIDSKYSVPKTCPQCNGTGKPNHG